MSKRNRPCRPRNEAIWRKIADQGFYVLLLMVLSVLSMHDLNANYRWFLWPLWGAAGTVIFCRLAYLGYQLYLERDEPVRNNTNPVYKCPPLPGDCCPVCGRRLVAKLTHRGRPAPMYTWVCPGSRCGYEWRI